MYTTLLLRKLNVTLKELNWCILKQNVCIYVYLQLSMSR